MHVCFDSIDRFMYTVTEMELSQSVVTVHPQPGLISGEGLDVIYICLVLGVASYLCKASTPHICNHRPEYGENQAR
jgi:hypothetical protein